MILSLPVLEVLEEREGEVTTEYGTCLGPGSLDVPESLIPKHV